MNVEPRQMDPHLFSRWVRGTFFGWLLGFVLVIVLALVWDMIGGGAQFIVGIGMGAGVGYVQGRVARPWLRETGQWTVVSIIGVGGPFVLGDLLAAAGIELPNSLPLLVVTGGLLVGVLQRRILRSYSERANWWVLACVAGWALPAGAIAVNDALRITGPLSGLVFGAAILLGGLVLGLVTGGTLVWMLRQPVAARAA